MGILDSLKVIPFLVNRVPNDYPMGELPWQVFHTVRNSIVSACREHGPTGPMGVVTISYHVSDPYMQLVENPNFWESGDKNPSYFVVDDQLNHERYCYAELCNADAFSKPWLTSIVQALRAHNGWGLGINHLAAGYVLIFGDRLLVNGPRLKRCKSASEVVDVVTECERNPPKPWWKFW